MAMLAARPIVVDSIMVDGKAANIAIQPIPSDSLTTYYIYTTLNLLVVGCCFFLFFGGTPVFDFRA